MTLTFGITSLHCWVNVELSLFDIPLLANDRQGPRGEGD